MFEILISAITALGIVIVVCLIAVIIASTAKAIKGIVKGEDE